MKKVDCFKCTQQHTCCDFGAWVDLEEAKKISKLGLKGIFYHLEPDDCFPSGYKVGTSYEEEKCSFLTKNGLCSIHKVDIKYKPSHCKEFPYEDGKLSSFAKLLCHHVKAKKKRKKISKK